jgi:hypothetical protein
MSQQQREQMNRLCTPKGLEKTKAADENKRVQSTEPAGTKKRTSNTEPATDAMEPAKKRPGKAHGGVVNDNKRPRVVYPPEILAETVSFVLRCKGTAGAHSHYAKLLEDMWNHGRLGWTAGYEPPLATQVYEWVKAAKGEGKLSSWSRTRASAYANLEKALAPRQRQAAVPTNMCVKRAAMEGAARRVCYWLGCQGSYKAMNAVLMLASTSKHMQDMLQDDSILKQARDVARVMLGLDTAQLLD